MIYLYLLSPKQERIVSILDKFDTLTNSITEVSRVKSSCARNNTSTIVIYCSVSQNLKLSVNN
ncbi:Uncharacterised protein [Escherichia coli]|uniref:Uncharacterized protein n=1 Tax=Escherichia coli TaxID=562 RepID=A0A2X1N5G0_ECOLX|nr:Uncharacterised protein [Escherichia coli]